jgi:GxxExxY protein
VYNQLGFGFLESVYQEGPCRALRRAGLRAEREVAIEVLLHGEVIGTYRADIVVDALVLLEIKAARRLQAEHEAQLLHYLRATPVEIGLLLNFGTKPEFKRLIFSNSVKAQR